MQSNDIESLSNKDCNDYYSCLSFVEVTKVLTKVGKVSGCEAIHHTSLVVSNTKVSLHDFNQKTFPSGVAG